MGFFHPFAIVKNAAVNIFYTFLGEYMFSFLLSIYLSMELLHKIVFALYYNFLYIFLVYICLLFTFFK